MSKRHTLSRRTLLKGLLGGTVVTVGLPWLESMAGRGAAQAAADGFPARFGMFFWGNGMLPERWVPSATGADWPLSDQLAPLAAVKDLVTVVTGMNVIPDNVIPHFSGAAGFLTGQAIILDGEDGQFAGPTFDQLAAEAIGGSTRFRSLEVGVASKGGFSHSGFGNKNPAEDSPHAIYERLFGVGFALPGEDVTPDPKVGLRRSVLDAVLGQASRLEGDLGAADRLRLEQHMDGVRELELQLARLQEDPPDLESCDRPDAPQVDYPDIDGRPQLSVKNRVVCDLLAMALACDQTRVFTHWFTAAVTNVLFPGVDAGHHQLTHDEPGEQPQVHAITLQCVEEYAYLVKRLSEVPEGDGTLLDHCAILGTSDVALGRTHSVTDFPILIAGSACGKLRQGIHHREPSGDNAAKIPVSLLRAVGVPLAGFGVGDAYTESGLSAIEV